MSEDKVKLEAVKENRVAESGNPLSKYTGTYLFKPIRKTWLANMDPKHDGAVVFEKAVHYVSPERDAQTGLIKTGISDAEARQLESMMGLKPMEMSPYNSAFWGDFKNHVKTTKEGVTIIPQRSAKDMFQYLYLKASKKVAMSFTDAENDPLCEYVLTSTEVEAKEVSNNFKVKMVAMQKLGKMTFEEQMNFLKVWEEGKNKVTVSSSPDFVLSSIGKVVEANPTGFIELLENPNYTTMVLVQDAVQAGLIKKIGTSHMLLGGDRIGFTYLDTINNLQKDEFQEVKISLLAKLNAKK